MKNTPLVILFTIISILYFFSIKKKWQYQNDLEEAHLIIEKLEEQSKDPGGFVLLNEEVRSITFENYGGTVIWYQTYDIEKLTNKYSSVNFHPIQTDKIIEGNKILVPLKARAFLLQGRINKGNEYSIHYGYDQ